MALLNEAALRQKKIKAHIYPHHKYLLDPPNRHLSRSITMDALEQQRFDFLYNNILPI